MVEGLHLISALLGLAIVADVGHEVILGLRIRRLAIWVDVVPQIQAFQREGHNRRVLLDEEIVIAEPLDNEDYIWRDAPQAISSDLAGLTTLGDGLERLLAVELLKQVEERNLRDEIEVVLEQWLVRKLQCHQYCLLLGLYNPSLIRRRAHLDLNLTLEHIVDHRAAILGLQLLVKIAHEPTEECHGVLLLRIELFRRLVTNGLVELVRRDEAFEIPRVVHLAQEIG
mmetsp:Transcript_113431/g.366971  ORF Transcript_113431/g.366971 Transcript_113431/m.366971 type:complete len:227 (+) Transcript_113431:298-978(+)